MTQEEKQLLFVDLCARQTFNVKVSIGADFNNDYIKPEGKEYFIPTLSYIDIQHLECHFKECSWTVYIGAIRHYLRPMSSMTDEEKEHLQSLYNIISDENYGDGYSPAAWEAISEFNDYCHAHHLDNRGLIGKGLALKAPEHMYD